MAARFPGGSGRTRSAGALIVGNPQRTSAQFLRGDGRRRSVRIISHSVGRSKPIAEKRQTTATTPAVADIIKVVFS
jgi:hypothetical protein